MGGAGEGSRGLSPLHTSSPSSCGLHGQRSPATRLTAPCSAREGARPPPAQASFLPGSSTSFYFGDWKQTCLCHLTSRVLKMF